MFTLFTRILSEHKLACDVCCLANYCLLRCLVSIRRPVAAWPSVQRQRIILSHGSSHAHMKEPSHSNLRKRCASCTLHRAGGTLAIHVRPAAMADDQTRYMLQAPLQHLRTRGAAAPGRSACHEGDTMPAITAFVASFHRKAGAYTPAPPMRAPGICRTRTHESRSRIRRATSGRVSTESWRSENGGRRQIWDEI